ncbi:MAG TPA: zinc-binding alcohol dehydrogenase family protein [Actinomycetota bacterium]|nr:zinc-binding alcohol dehydrogenase family protein [Actinomycetota bacterium]
MKAARVHAFGEPLRIDDVPNPEPGPDDVVLDVGLAAVNPVDVWLTDGTVAGGTQQLPFVPGVEAIGSVDGRPVIVRGGGVGVTRDGTYRERADLPRGVCVEIPEGLDPERVAGIAVTGTTAWVITNELAQIRSEDRVLVLGASGGVGSLAVQLAKAAGATVWGQTSSPEKASFIESLGADHVVVSQADELPSRVEGLEPTAVLDPLGDRYTTAAVEILEPHGRLVLFGVSAGDRADVDLRTLYRKAIQLLTYSGTIEPDQRNRDGLERVLAAAARGEVRVPVDEVLPLEDAAEAHRRIRERQVQGKLLLRP